MCRLILAATFIFSGYVKAIDPLGTQYKIQDYLVALGLYFSLHSLIWKQTMPTTTVLPEPQ